MPLTKHQQEIRARCLYMAGYMTGHEWLEGYSEARPYARPKWKPTRYFTNDCSGTLKLLFEWCGAPSPDGEAWGYGNTATLVTHGWNPGLNPSRWQPMDYVFYGNPWAGGPGGHVAMLTHKDDRGRWHVVSHGSERGPKDELAHYRSPVAVRRYRIPAKG